MTTIDGTALEGVSATSLWTLHNRGTEAKRSDGVIRDPWAVTLLDTISYDYLKFAARFPGGQMMFDSIPRWFSARTLRGFRLSERYLVPPMPFGLSADEALSLAGTVPGVRTARDVAFPAGRRLWKVMSAPALDRIGPLRRNRPSLTLLEFA